MAFTLAELKKAMGAYTAAFDAALVPPGRLGEVLNDAGAIEARGRGRGPLVEGWRQRLRAHEYPRLAGVELVRPERIERWSWDELGASDAPSRPPDMKPGETYVRAPLEVTRLANEKVFDDVMVMLLRLEDGRYKVSAYGEVEGP